MVLKSETYHTVRRIKQTEILYIILEPCDRSLNIINYSSSVEYLSGFCHGMDRDKRL